MRRDGAAAPAPGSAWRDPVTWALRRGGVRRVLRHLAVPAAATAAPPRTTWASTPSTSSSCRSCTRRSSTCSGPDSTCSATTSRSPSPCSPRSSASFPRRPRCCSSRRWRLRFRCSRWSAPGSRCREGRRDGSIGFAYGFSWGLQQMIVFDFHELVLAVPLLAFSLSALVRRHTLAAICWALPMVLVEESQGFTVAAIGFLLATAAVYPGVLPGPARAAAGTGLSPPAARAAARAGGGSADGSSAEPRRPPGCASSRGACSGRYSRSPCSSRTSTRPTPTTSGRTAAPSAAGSPSPSPRCSPSWSTAGRSSWKRSCCSCYRPRSPRSARRWRCWRCPSLACGSCRSTRCTGAPGGITTRP